MHYTYRLDVDFAGFEVEFLQFFNNLIVQLHVRLNTVAKMPQDNKGKQVLHHTAALSLFLLNFSCLKCDSWCDRYLHILFIYKVSGEKEVTDVIAHLPGNARIFFM